MAKRMNVVFFPRMMFATLFVLTVSLTAWAIHPAALEISGPNRGPVVLDDDCGDCTIDYTGLRWSGSGGLGGRGVIHWPGGSTANNYGQMCFLSTCELGNPLYAWCTDVYHPVETLLHGVDYAYMHVTDDSCRKAQLTAMAYLLAWHFPTSTFEDDAYQLALWKLSSIRDGGANDGLPHFCYDAGRVYPNLGDPPAYPYVNTVYGTNVPRNDWANAKALESIGKNVILPADAILDTCYSATVDGDSATVLLKFTLQRNEFAAGVGNSCLENVCFDICYWTFDGDTVLGKYYTDAEGCVWLSVTQAIEERQGVNVKICSNWAWPIAITGCEDSVYANNQWLIFSGEGQPLCFEFYFEGDKWLSVELSSFDAYTTENGVDLRWSTASETNADHWEIERCVNGSGQFETIAHLPARNSATGATYQFADRHGSMGTTYDYRLIDVDVSGARTIHPNSATALFGGYPAAVLEYKLADAYPNPFNPSTTISFAIPEAGHVELKIFDLSGREISVLVNGAVAAGSHSVDWNAESLPSGTYFYTMKSANYTASKKLLLLK